MDNNQPMQVTEILSFVLDMLNKISVSGKENLMNLGNAIVNIENVHDLLSANQEQ